MVRHVLTLVGGRLGTTHYMSKRVLVDSIKYLVDTYKVDGFRFDMMGDHDAASIERSLQGCTRPQSKPHHA